MTVEAITTPVRQFGDSLDDEWTLDLFRCSECKHRGPALLDCWEEQHPAGEGYATETLCELLCAKCGSPNINEAGEE